MKHLNFFLVVVAIAMAIGANAQVMKVRKDTVSINAPFTRINCNGNNIMTVNGGGVVMNKPANVSSSGTSDVFRVSANSCISSNLPASANLMWGCLYREQYSNPGLLSFISYSAGYAWNPCFTIRANGNVGIFNSDPAQALVVGSYGMPKQVAVNGTVVLGSDSLLKRNIENISAGSLNRLKHLRGVTYQLKSEVPSGEIPEKMREDPNFPQELLHAPAPVSKKINSVATRKHYGFVAQDVQKIFPELVYEMDSAGMLSVDYIGMIPILLEGVKEQQTQIESQQTQIESQQMQIEELQEQLAAVQQILENGGGQLSLARVQEKAVLYQNSPNPFNQSTEIRFYIPTDVQTATIYIYDINGLQKTKYPIAGREEGSITISGATLDAGSYFYTLVCDGVPVASKQMVLTR